MTPLAILGTFFAYYVIRSPLAHCSASNSYLELIQTNTNVWVTTTFTHSMLHHWHSVRWNEGHWSHIVALFAVILTHCINDHLKSKADLIFKTTSIYFNRLTHFETVVEHDNSCTAWPMKNTVFLGRTDLSWNLSSIIIWNDLATTPTRPMMFYSSYDPSNTLVFLVLLVTADNCWL